MAQHRNMPRARQKADLAPFRELFLVNCAIGFGVAALFVFGLIVADGSFIGPMLMHEPPAAVLLWLFAGLTFASAQTGASIMSIEHRANSAERSER
jgi:4-hydroxybenzoate polyprenyltransferase